MKTRYLVPGILWLLSGPLLAQDSTQLTLQQAVRLGVQNSKQLKVAYAQTQEAQAQLAQARQRRYPSVDLSATHLQVGSSQIETHVGRPASAEPEPGTGVAATPDVSQVTYGLVSVSQPIFTGFKLRYSVQAANDLKRAAELNAESQQEAVMLNIIDAYYTFYKLAATRRLIAQSLAQAKERVRVFTNQEQNGVLTRNDLLKAQLQQSNIELSLMEVDNNLSVANFNLGILLGLPSGILIALDTARMSHAVPTVAPLDFYQQQAQENRPDLKAAGSQEQAAHANMLATRSGYYPSLALSGGYINAYIPGLLTVNNALNAGLGLRYSLTGIINTRHQVQEAKAKQDERALAVSLQQDGIKSAVFKEYADYQQSLKKIENLRIAEQQAAENYRLTQNSYQNSVALLTDLLDAEVARLQTQVDQLQAQADAQLSYYRLEEASGGLSHDFTVQP